MGGRGSGRQGKRSVVEDGLTLDIGFMQRSGLLEPKKYGSLQWTRMRVSGNTRAGSISYSVNDEGLILGIQYKRTADDGAETITEMIKLQKTPAFFGGYRFWAQCPIEGCTSGKLAKLYLPRGERFFGCRRCYDLTYRSSNASHESESFYRRLGGTLGFSPEKVKRIMASPFW